jgi:hypothetical protein
MTINWDRYCCQQILSTEFLAFLFIILHSLSLMLFTCNLENENWPTHKVYRSFRNCVVNTVGAFNENLSHVANVDNQRNSTILQVSVALQQHFHSNAYAQHNNAYVQQYRLHRCYDTTTVSTWLTATLYVTGYFCVILKLYKKRREAPAYKIPSIIVVFVVLVFKV